MRQPSFNRPTLRVLLLLPVRQWRRVCLPLALPPPPAISAPPPMGVARVPPSFFPRRPLRCLTHRPPPPPTCLLLSPRFPPRFLVAAVAHPVAAASTLLLPPTITPCHRIQVRSTLLIFLLPPPLFHRLQLRRQMRVVFSLPLPDLSPPLLFFLHLPRKRCQRQILCTSLALFRCIFV